MNPTLTRGLAPVRAVLPNGAVVIAKQSRTTPAVTIQAGVHAGSIYDPMEMPGIAHFVSRTIDRGTRARTADQIADALDNLGITLSVAVNRHGLSLVCTCLVEDFRFVLELIGECLMAPAFPETEVETRRGEIVTTIRQDEDNPATVALDGLMAALYGDTHPYGRRLRGSVESVERMPRQALIDFHARHFVPAALSLVMVGDLEPAQAIEMAAEVFGGWSGGPRVEPGLAEAPPHASRDVRVVPMMNKAQADIAYGVTSVLRKDPEYYACWLMNNILGQYSIGGRLGDRIRERQGMAYYVVSTLDANIIRGPLMVRAGVNPANVDRAIASIDEELSTLAAEGPTEKEMVESRQYLIGSMPRNLETNMGIATFLQTAEFFGLGLDYDLRLPDLLRAVTREQVHAAARRLLDPSKATVVIAGPYERA